MPARELSPTPLISWLWRKGGISRASIDENRLTGEFDDLFTWSRTRFIFRRRAPGESVYDLAFSAFEDGRIRDEDPTALAQAIMDEASGRRAYYDRDELDRMEAGEPWTADDYYFGPEPDPGPDEIPF